MHGPTLTMTLAEIQDFYFARLAAAAVRGAVLSGRIAPPGWERAWIDSELGDLDDEEQARIVAAGLEAGMRLHRFKRTMGLPRVTKVLGWLRGFDPATLLDIGSGRGAFLWPMLDAFPALPVTSLEASETRAAQLAEVARGGVVQLTVVRGDLTAEQELPPVHDLVTALEIWEHIPDVARAVRHSVGLARRAVIASVPSGEDENPEHLHLLTRSRLTELLALPRVRQLRFDAVPGHLFAIATLQDHA